MTPVTVFLISWTAVFGLVIGSFLNVVAYRVPAGIPLTRESRCPSCDTGIRWFQNVPVVSWLALRGRCAACSAPISPRYPIVEAVTGILFAAIAATLAANPATLAAKPPTPTPATPNWPTDPAFWGTLILLLVFASLSVVLTLIDLDTKRLPNAIVLPGWAAIIVIELVTSAITGAWMPLLQALIGGAALYAFYFIVRFISPRGMGGGDVKLAGLVGTVLGWFGWGALAVGAFAAFVLGGLFGVVLIVARRAKHKTAIPFGPWILAGAWVGIVAGEPVGRWYLGLYS